MTRTFSKTESSLNYFLPHARTQLRQAIEEHGKLEVFFIGRPGDVTGKIQSVEALCKGSAHSVPAILDAARHGEVVIHNHPSGHLAPSDADVQLASHYGNIGVGFLIVDNAVEQVLTVVKPFARAPRQHIDSKQVEERLGPGGQLATQMPEYEYRPEQIRMAEAVLHAFNQDGIVAIEAGTGTGKSLAYLLPAGLSALANKELVVVATRTINLQEQLFSKDSPQVKALDGLADLRFAVMKGRSNYLCNRKFLFYLDRPRELFDVAADQLLDSLNVWFRSTKSGTRSELNYLIPDDIWERVACDEDDCTKVRCEEYEKCFYYRARQEASAANILIVNQHLLMADLAVRHATGDYKRAFVLPPYRRIILDEAHHLEDSGTSFISGKVTLRGLSRFLGRLLASRSPKKENEARRGLLVLLQKRLSSASTSLVLKSSFNDLIGKLNLRIDGLRKDAKAYLMDIAFQLKLEMEQRYGGIQPQFRIRDEFTSSNLWREGIRQRVSDLRIGIDATANQIGQLVELWDQLPETFKNDEQQIVLELGAIRSKLAAYSERIQEFLSGGENLVRWLELERANTNEPSVRICTSPIEVSAILAEMIFDPLKTVVMTSATLSVAGKFDYFSARVGLNAAPKHRVQTESVPSHFDLRSQVYLGIPQDLPDPRDRQYRDRLVEVVEEAVLRSGGGAFVLFTSYSLLNFVHDEIQRRGRVDFPLLKHGSEARHRLLAKFKAENDAVLFGTSSFWEGVDVRGEALRMVIITRLPFHVPSEPIQEARAEAIKARGGDPFREISLPQAVIQFKQGFGRLIRHKEDRGVVLVLDQRIVSKFYGANFLDSVPKACPIVASTEDILADISDFFSGTYKERETSDLRGRRDSRGWQGPGGPPDWRGQQDPRGGRSPGGKTDWQGQQDWQEGQAFAAEPGPPASPFRKFGPFKR